MSGNKFDTPEWRLAHPDDYPTGDVIVKDATHALICLLYTSPSPRD